MKFTNVKKWLAMLLAVCSMLSLVACGKSDKDSAGDDSEKGTKVAVVFASSGLGDKSFNDALYNGMKKAERPWASSGYIPSLRMTPSTRA